MAPGTRRRGTIRQRTIAQSLLDSQHDRNDGLHGPVKTNAHIRLENMVMYLELDSSVQLRAWLDSPQFKPYFEELYQNTILPRLTKDPNLQGPQLRTVRSAMIRGESFGDQKYSAKSVDTAHFDQVDHYAYCMVQLIDCNTHNRHGVFYQKLINAIDKEARMWMAILRGNHEKSNERRASRKANELRLNIHRDIFSDLPNQSMALATSTPTTSTPTTSAPTTSTPTKHTPTKSTPTKSTPTKSTPTESTPTRSTPKKLKTSHPNRGSNTPSRVSSGTQRRSNSDLVENLLDSSLHRSSPSPQPIDNIGSDLEYDSDDSDIDGVVDKFQRLLITSSADNPLDLKTEFGIYTTLHIVLRYFSDRTKLQRLTTGPDRNTCDDTEEFDRLTQQWHQEIRAIIDKRHSIAFEPTDEDQKQADIFIEAMLDNSIYQPMDYEAACEFLFDLDLEAPRLFTMNATARLHPWQVTGIARIPYYTAPKSLL